MLSMPSARRPATTSYPSAASRKAVARPIPEFAPVTTAIAATASPLGSSCPGTVQVTTRRWLWSDGAMGFLIFGIFGIVLIVAFVAIHQQPSRVRVRRGPGGPPQRRGLPAHRVRRRGHLIVAVRLSPAARELLDSDVLGTPRHHRCRRGAAGVDHLDRPRRRRGRVRPPQPHPAEAAQHRPGPPVVVSIESDVVNDHGLREVPRAARHGAHHRRRGRAAAAPGPHRPGPDVQFPPMDEPPPGVVTDIDIERVSGVGDWTVA